MSAPRGRFPWLLLVILVVGLGVVAGGVSVYADQKSGTGGEARVWALGGAVAALAFVALLGWWRRA